MRYELALTNGTGTVAWVAEEDHGGPLATRLLLPEAFDVRVRGWDGARERGLDVDADGAVAVAAATLRGRLDGACRLLGGRRRITYTRRVAEDDWLTPAELQAFVRLAGELEERGDQPRFRLQVDD